MAVEVPTFDQLMWPTLLSLKQSGGSASNEELLAKVIETAQISDDTASILHVDNRQSKLNYNLAWAKTYLKKAGAITNSRRGVWALTEIGESVSEREVAAIPAEVRRTRYDSRRRDVLIDSINQSDADPADGENESASWKNLLLSLLQGVEPAAFERLAQRILREAGFVKVEVTGRSGDGGIDGVGVLRVNPLISFTTLFQCKRYVGTVGAGAVRDFRGAMMGRSDKGLIITTGTFSTDARREATRDGAPALELIDGDQLCNLLKDLKLGLRTEVVEKIIVEEDWFGQL